MVLKIFTFLSVLLLTTPEPLLAQCLTLSDGIRPSWINSSRHRPQETDKSNFMLITVEGQTLDEARRNAEKEFLAKRSMIYGDWVKLHNGNDGVTFQIGNDDVPRLFRAQCISEYHEFECKTGKYKLWQIVQIAKKPKPNEPLETISRNQIKKLEENTLGLKPFVPGMAQIHRNSNAKGTFFIVGTSALVGGIVATNMLSANNASRVNTTFNVAQRQTYINNANTLHNWRNISIATIGAVYVWNVIDGFVGRKSSICGYKAESDFKITPYADLHGTGGLILSFGF